MAKVNSIAEALKLVKEKVEDTLLFDVAEIIKNVEIYHVYKDVYPRPESAKYKRRYSQGGIGDKGNLEGYIEEDTLVVANNTAFNPYLNGFDSHDGYSRNAGQGLDGLVEYGDGGWKSYTYDWAEGEPARPFIRNTVEDLKAKKDHVRVLAAGLRKRGLSVKMAK